MFYHYLLLFTPVMMGVVLTILTHRMNKEEKNNVRKKKLFNNQGESTQDEAKLSKATEENALSEHDAVDTNQNWADKEPCFLEDDGVFLEPPTSITRARSNNLRGS